MTIDQTALFSPAASAAKNTADSASPAKDVKADFLSFMEMSTEEKFLMMYLRQEKMTKEEFEALPPEEKEEIMVKIREKIRKDVEEKAGIV